MSVINSIEDLSEADRCLRDELYCIADAKLVLAGWYMMVLQNGRSIADFTSICAMMQGQYGHARALYQHLGRFGVTLEEVEWTRGAKDIRSPKLLDRPPQSWSDFIATIFMAEQAISTQLSAYRTSLADRTLARLADKILKESRFHLSYSVGWIKALRKDSASTVDEDARRRLVDALDWWGDADRPDVVFSTGYRDTSDSDLRDRFLKAIGATFDVPDGIVGPAKSWQPSIRRNGRPGIPENLFEKIGFKNRELAMP
ncbi:MULTISPECIES: Phenylacetic acid catabolic protein [unclassified Bradyrhizobium]|uniref:Phenylacetic acid catabolic protein n=1 Tax=unclassified Bradyrhizobium TaxID=2631580 RepID=UPI001FF33A4A|nr:MULTISPECIES: Phenylacetic acid catabolic protein [unclassified Bradyrhizobium]MCJ9699881.1 phenylacetate-CoA oxygenase subunit PaaI [Bradyrhizobium sp. SHOUNA76]MCJ9728884.1 phenylacetate-CoA oxygenase subunit PaaI [Bradyrhizobium sp. PRIMUS42]